MAALPRSPSARTCRRTSSSRGATRRGRNSGGASGTSRAWSWAARSGFAVPCRKSWASWASSTGSRSSRGRSRRISERATEHGHCDDGGEKLEDADPDRGDDEDDGPWIGRHDRHLIRARDDEVTLEAVGEGRGHDDDEEGRQPPHARGTCLPGNPSDRHAATTSPRPFTKVGNDAVHRKSERNRAFDVGKDAARRSAVYRPTKRRATDRETRRGGRVPSFSASNPRNSRSDAGRSSTTCHRPGFGHSEAATKALAASSACSQDQTPVPPSTRTGRPRKRDSARILVCQPSAE